MTASFGYLYNFLVHVWEPAVVNGETQIGHVMITNDDGSQVIESQFPDNHSARGNNITLTPAQTLAAEGRSADNVYYISNGPNMDAGIEAGRAEQSKSTWQVISLSSDQTNCSFAADHVLSVVNSSYNFYPFKAIPSPWSINSTLNALSGLPFLTTGVVKLK